MGGWTLVVRVQRRGAILIHKHWRKLNLQFGMVLSQPKAALAAIDGYLSFYAHKADECCVGGINVVA